MNNAAARINAPLLLFFCGGIGSAFLLTQTSPGYGLIFAGAALAGWIVIFRTELALYALFFAVLITSDGIPLEAYGSGEFFYILEPDLPGLPSLLNVMLLGIALVYFARLFLFERRASAVPIRFLALYLAIAAVALATGIKNGWDLPDKLRLEFLKMVLPVLCFTLCVNVFQDLSAAKRMIWVLFAAAVVKASLLDLYYLAGRGFPYEDYRIVSFDTAELMAFVVLSLLACKLFMAERVQGVNRILLGLGVAPMLFAVVFSFRRGHWLGMAVSLLLLYRWSPLIERRRLAAIGLKSAVILVPVACLLLLIGVTSSDRIAAGADKVVARLSTLADPSQGSNKHHLQEALQVLRDLSHQPILGLGLASSHSVVDENLGGWADETQPLDIVHNTFLYVWMKLGLAGLLFLLWCGGRFWLLLRRYRLDHPNGEQEPYVLAFGAALGIWLIMFLTGPVPFYFHQTYLIALIAALTVVLIDAEDSEAIGSGPPNAAESGSDPVLTSSIPTGASAQGTA